MTSAFLHSLPVFVGNVNSAAGTSQEVPLKKDPGVLNEVRSLLVSVALGLTVTMQWILDGNLLLGDLAVITDPGGLASTSLIVAGEQDHGSTPITFDPPLELPGPVLLRVRNDSAESGTFFMVLYYTKRKVSQQEWASLMNLRSFERDA